MQRKLPHHVEVLRYEGGVDRFALVEVEALAEPLHALEEPIGHGTAQLGHALARNVLRLRCHPTPA